MRIALSIIFVVLVVALSVCVFFAFRSKKAIGKSVAILVASLIPPVIGNLFIIASPNEIISTIGCYVYFLGMDLVMYAITRFTFDYCDLPFPKKIVKGIIYGILILDAIQLLMNTFAHHAFTLELINVSGADYYRFVPLWGQTIHRVVDYTILAAVLVTFIVKSIRAPRVYAEKYLVILFAMLAVAAWQTFYIVSRTPMDISMTGFGVFGVLVFVLALYYRPLRLLDRMLAAIASRMPEALFFFDTTNRCIWYNEKATELLKKENYSEEDVAGFLKSITGDYISKDYDTVNTHTNGSGDDFVSYVVEKHAVIDDRKHIVGFYLSVRDNSDEQKTLQRETYNATHDSLTKVFNRAGYDAATKEVDINNCFLIVLDIDSFKETNDKFGHNIGDRVLVHMAGVLQKHFRSDDYLCRVGGDEFAIIIPNADKNTAKAVNDKIRDINTDLKDIRNDLPVVTISAGGAYGNGSENFLELFNDADHALYETKFNGKCGFTLFKKR